MTPGPVPLPPAVLRTLSLPVEHHRTPGFQASLKTVLGELPTVFETNRPCFLQTATGSGGMESLLVNALSPGETVLSITSGKFGERWAEIAKTYGADVIPLEITWGKSTDIVQLEAWLNQLKRNSVKPAIFLTQACETSTGVLHPIREMAQVLRRVFPETLFFVDAITALGALPLPMDQWEIDGIVGGSQKAFMLPTGLSFLSYSERAWTKVLDAKCPRYYFDIREEAKANSLYQTRFSSSVLLIKALQTVFMGVSSAGGWDHVRARVALISLVVRTSLTALGLKIFSEFPSPSVTAIEVPEGKDGQKWRSELETKHGLILMGGQDLLKGKILRIGHMGYITDDEILTAIKLIAETSGQNPSEASLKQVLSLAKSELKKEPLAWMEPHHE